MKRLEHLGIAVADLAEAERIFTDVLGVPPYKREEVADEGVITSFFQTGDSKVELLESTTPAGPIARHIAKRGPGLHHVAFLVDDLEGESLGWKVKATASSRAPREVQTASALRFCTRRTRPKCWWSSARTPEAAAGGGRQLRFLRAFFSPLLFALPWPCILGSNSVLEAVLRVGAAHPCSGFRR